ARHVFPLHLRQRHLYRALRRPFRWQGHEDRRVEGRCLDERHRVAGSRVLRRDPREARAECQRCDGAAVLPHAASARAAARARRLRRAAAAMKQRRIGPFTVTAIGLGCMNLSHAYGAPPAAADAEALLLAALAAGVTYFDTAAL